MICAQLSAGRADEGKPWQAVAKAHADTGGLASWIGVGRYTDDTQMSLALAQSLVNSCAPFCKSMRHLSAQPPCLVPSS